MGNRREFMQASLAAFALPFLAHPVLAGVQLDRPTGSASAVIVNRDSPAARSFGEEAAGIGFPVEARGREITPGWYNELSARWAEKPAVLAGMTTADTLFCIERLASRRGIRIIFRAEHVPQGNGVIGHKFVGPGLLVRNIGFGNRSDRWTNQMAQLVAAYRLRPHHTDLPHTARFLTQDQSPEAEPLVTWIIAPTSLSQA